MTHRTLLVIARQGCKIGKTQLDCTLKDFILSAPLYKVHIMVDFTHVNVVLIIVWCIYSETVGEPGCADYSAE